MPGHLAPVVQTLDSAILWINHYPLDNSIGFASVYPLDSNLSGGQRYPSFEQLGPGVGTHGWVARIASQRSATWPLDIPGTQPPLCNLVVNYCLKWPGIVENSTRKRKKRLYSFS